MDHPVAVLEDILDYFKKTLHAHKQQSEI